MMESSSEGRRRQFVGGLASAALAAAGASLLVGCGARHHYVPSPQAAYASELAEAKASSEAPTIYIIVQQAEGAEAPEIVTRDEGWTPSAFPGPNPFDRARTWVGDYDCVQGNTGLALRIVDVRGRVVRAIFDFQHAPTGAAGSYLISGAYDPETRRVRFDPSKWIVQPEDYVMVSMEGEVSSDSSLFAGRITFPGCGAFHLKPTR